MPQNENLKKVLVIGSGPIVIGQAAEFDYAGTQACKSLREEGVEVVLVNSNPATIMTDEDVADRVYIEPLTVPVVQRIIEREKPDGILGTLGGQTGLNLTVELEEAGALKDVMVMGTKTDSIRKAEDRELFASFMGQIGEPISYGIAVTNIPDAEQAAAEIGYPIVVRPAYTLGGTGGGVANNIKELHEIVNSGLAASLVNQVLIEKSLLGWKEIEYEVMRDSAGNVITVCNMENFDPMGVHTGDSIVVAPSQTLTDKDYQRLRTAALHIIHSLEIEGGCNVQFAYRPGREVGEKLGQGSRYDDEGPMYYVIEVNPRVSRSSALASKATGYPIARVASKVALGLHLDEISNVVTGKTRAAFEPALDYCVAKIPRWPFDKFGTGDRSLGTQMKATGEVMAIDRSFEAALMKAVRSLEDGKRSLRWEDSDWRANGLSDVNLSGDDLRLWKLAFKLRTGTTPEELTLKTGIDLWFTSALARIVGMERKLQESEHIDAELMLEAKRVGLSDEDIAEFSDIGLAERVREMRKDLGIVPVYKMVDTCAGEFEASTPYFYSTYEEENEALPLGLPSLAGELKTSGTAIVIGSGPIRIGQGIEFDYCSVHAAWALQNDGIRSIMINSNPETVSTDFDTSDRLYFEPLDHESVRDIIDNEMGNGATSSSDVLAPNIVVQFGGQTAINLSQSLNAAGLQDLVLGSDPQAIDNATDRGRFEQLAISNGLPLPPGGTASNTSTALVLAENLGYPVLVRPSYVLGGRAMEIVDNPNELEHYFNRALRSVPGQTILVDRYFQGVEVEVDAVCDGRDVLIPGIMQHIERAGVHSGDSFAVYPAIWLTGDEVETIVEYTRRIGRMLNVRGLMNIQYVITGGGTYRSSSTDFERRDASSSVTWPASEMPDTSGLQQLAVEMPKAKKAPKTETYIIEVNPRSSRTIPFISKVTGIPMIRIATQVMLGKQLRDMKWGTGLMPRRDLVAVKAPVFSMSKLASVDTFLGPEMKSTGEVMGIDRSYVPAVTKALIASSHSINYGDSVLLSIADAAKPDAERLIRTLGDNGHAIYATSGTARFVRSLGYQAKEVERLLSTNTTNVVTLINDGTVQAVINIPTGGRAAEQDGFYIRRAAVERRIPCFTSIDTARCAVDAAYAANHVKTDANDNFHVMTLSEYVSGSPTKVEC